ncbi:hypothetical protein M501DRAFT_992705 [Patellaria atrata CBS 101060]|uniref:Heterokaryon incompatibility domain-containing protein n=1 Tax=Patellaria atrata CBS 101060 TaxID=1346257 RepID=A0A9P4VQV9_9PEZI|nr:hypothetical protein M501DRAFT_992705 [Patellaria atrata CBS 101060]
MEDHLAFMNLADASLGWTKDLETLVNLSDKLPGLKIILIGVTQMAIGFAIASLGFSMMFIGGLLKLFGLSGHSYQFEPLPNERTIRLFELHPGAGVQPVVGRLRFAKLDRAPPYEAVSYVSDEPRDAEEVVCNGKSLEVSMNLYAALQRVRLQNRPRMLWVDQVCMDQKNDKERGQQMMLMGDIFTHADDVLVWLGENEDDDADLAFGLIKELNAHFLDLVQGKGKKKRTTQSIPEITPDQLTRADDHKWNALSNLLCRAWFNDIFIIRQIGVASSAEIMCGDYAVDWRELVISASWIIRKAPQLEAKYQLRLDNIVQLSQGFRVEPDDITFLDVLQRSRHYNSFDPRDKVFALLDHPSASTPPGQIQPDYTKPVLEIYWEVAVKLLAQTKSLALLSHVQRTAHNDKLHADFPSWLPRWDLHSDCNILGTSSSYYTASGTSSPIPTKSDTWSILITRGLLFDTITKACKPLRSRDFAIHPSSTSPPRRRTTHKPHAVATLWKECGAHSPDHIYPTRENETRVFSLTLTAGLNDRQQPADPDVLHHTADFSAYWLQACEPGNKSRASSTVSPHPDSDGDEDAAYLDSLRAAAAHGSAGAFSRAAAWACDQRRFFVTAKGYFGIGPEVLRPDDKVVVLFGGKVPFVLRRVTGKEAKWSLILEILIW